MAFHYSWNNIQSPPLSRKAWHDLAPDLLSTHITLAPCHPHQPPLWSEPIPNSKSLQCVSASKSLRCSPWLVHFYSSGLTSKGSPRVVLPSWPLSFQHFLLPSKHLSHCVNIGFISLSLPPSFPLSFSLILPRLFSSSSFTYSSLLCCTVYLFSPKDGHNSHQKQAVWSQRHHYPSGQPNVKSQIPVFFLSSLSESNQLPSISIFIFLKTFSHPPPSFPFSFLLL